MVTQSVKPLFTLRTPVPSDAAALAAVHAGRSAVDQVDPVSTLEHLPDRLQLADALKRAQANGEQERWLVVQVGERVTGYSRVDSWHERDGTWVYLIRGWVLPEWRNQGIGSAMLDHLETLCRQLAAVEHPGERAEFAANASSTELDATRLLVEKGYRPGYTVLELDLDPDASIAETALPPGIQVRPVLPSQVRQVARQIAVCVGRCYQDEFEQNRFADDFDVDWYTLRLTEPQQDPSLWQVAWSGEDVVGQALSIYEKGRAEVFEVSVLPDFRRHGLARALLTRALVSLRQRGYAVIRLHTVAEFKTRARDLYQSVGFRLLKEFPRYRKPMR